MSRNRAVKANKKMNPQENTINFDQAKPAKHRPIDLVPRTRNQERLVLALRDESQHIVVTAGPAGTGKTYLSILRAIQALRNNECERIVLVRPAVAVDNENHGFLPGDLNQKLEPWCLPLLDVLHEYYKPADVARMIADKTIEMAPLSMMRGRTLKNVFLVADEMQNSTPNSLKALLTRIGENSKFVIAGDTEQADKRDNQNGLLDLLNRLKKGGIDGLSLCEFGTKDIQRHHMITHILKMYE